MSYTRKTWADGEIITAEDLNNLEEGVNEAINATRGPTIPTPLSSDAGKFLRANSNGEYVLETVSVATDTDPGAGVSVSYPEGTVIDVYE